MWYKAGEKSLQQYSQSNETHFHLRKLSATLVCGLFALGGHFLILTILSCNFQILPLSTIAYTILSSRFRLSARSWPVWYRDVESSNSPVYLLLKKVFRFRHRRRSDDITLFKWKMDSSDLHPQIPSVGRKHKKATPDPGPSDFEFGLRTHKMKTSFYFSGKILQNVAWK